MHQKAVLVNHRQFLRAVAVRFPDLTQRQVEEILDILVEIWRSELAQPRGEVVIRGFGRLTVEVQQVRNAGVIRYQMGVRQGNVPNTLRRLYFRFLPTAALRAEVVRHLKEEM